MSSEPLTIRPAQFLFSLWVALFSLILINGYVLNLLGLPASAWLIFVLVVAEFAGLALWFGKSSARISGDPIELGGFLLVVVGVYAYFLLPSLPTLLPPSYSVDPVNHLAHANAVFQSGRIISDYPGGGALMIATIAHWVDALPLRVEHPLATLWIALTAGGIYLLACSMLPCQREYKTLALFAAFALFIPWTYFGGMLIQFQYFSTQVAAQLFLVAFIGYLGEYSDSHHPVWLIGMALCLISISVLFQLWLAVPMALLGACLLKEWCKTQLLEPVLIPLLVVVGLPVLFWLAILLWGTPFIPQLSRLGSGGAIAPPSLAALGSVFLILPLLGVLLSKNAGYRIWLSGGFLVLTVLQCLAAIVARAFGLSDYWVSKTFYLLILPLALFAVIPLARAVEWAKYVLRRNILSSVAGFSVTFIALASLALFIFPPPSVSILSETDVRVALWAKEHLDTRLVHYVGRKSLVANWLVALWGESVPDDMLVDLAALGPKTFEEWRADPDWGEYLFVAAGQRLPLDPALRVLYQHGDSLIVQKPDSRRTGVAGNAIAQVGSIFSLIDYTAPAQSLRAGETISLTLRLGTKGVPANEVTWRLQLRDLENNAAAETRIVPFAGKFPLQRWPDQVTLSQPLSLTLPVDIRSGLYDLQLGLYYTHSGAALPFKTLDGAEDDVIHLSRIKVALPPTTPHELASTTRANWKVGDLFALVGYRLKNASTLKPGDRFTAILYWQCQAAVSQDYTVFVHLTDATGHVIAQNDGTPRHRTYPTSIWDINEIIPDSYALVIPGDAAPGDYRIQIGMYSMPDVRRLSIMDAETHSVGDYIELPVQVTVH